MNVELISFTPMALELLLRTKNTRLSFNSDPATWPAEKKAEHLAYMKDTIKSSWEFCDYTFEISGVTRAFTHQLVRTRTGSYAQESQRTVDVRDHEILNPFVAANVDEKNYSCNDFGARLSALFDHAGIVAKDAYAELINEGATVQDARGILPTNMTTSIVAKFNLRTLHEMAKVRLCVRTQGEYGNVFRAMRAEVIKVHPWVEEFKFIEVACVADGICAFPRYGKTSCQFYDPRMDQTAVKNDTHEKFWAAKEIAVAVPIAKDGKTM